MAKATSAPILTTPAVQNTEPELHLLHTVPTDIHEKIKSEAF